MIAMTIAVAVAAVLMSSAIALADSTAPTVEAGPDATINEGDTFAGTGSFSDDAGPWTVTIDFGDGSSAEVYSTASTGTIPLSHTYADNDLYTVTVSVDDGDGPVTATSTVGVLDVLPVIDPIPDASINEGDTFTDTGSFTDPGDDEWIVSVDYGDGSAAATSTPTAAKTFDMSHDYDQDGTYSVIVTVIDDVETLGFGQASATSSTSFSVAVSNVAPTIAAGVDSSVDEGSPLNYSGTFTDPGNETWTVTIDFGDGVIPGSSTGTATVAPHISTSTPTHGYAFTHTYSDNGMYTVTVTVDDGTDTDSTTFDATVSNVAPAITSLSVVGGLEGSPMAFDMEFTDPGADSWDISIDPGDGSPATVASVTSTLPVFVPYMYADDGTYTVSVTITDDDGGSASSTVSAPVSNFDPVIDLNDDGAVDSSGNFARTGTVLDLGVNDGPWTVDVDYNNGGEVETLTTATGAFSLAHNYDANGLFTVSVTATDKDGGFSTTAFQVGVFQGLGPDPLLVRPVPSVVIWNNAADFSATEQDIWGPLTGPTGEAQWQLFYESWSKTGSVGKIYWNVVFGWDFGAQLSAGTSGHVGMYGKVSGLEGEVDVEYPVELDIDVPGVNSFLPGERLGLPSGWSLLTGASINAGESTSDDLSLHAQLRAAANIGATLCVFDCWSPTILNFDTGSLDFPIMSVDAADVLWLPAGLLGIGLDDLNPLSVQPGIHTVDAATGEITASGTKKFSTVTFDLDTIATRLGLVPPLGAEMTVPNHFSAGANLFDVKAIVDFFASQNLTFRGTPIIQLDLDPPVAGITGNFLSVAPDYSRVVYEAGSSVDVIFPSAQETPTTVTPTVWLENEFTNDTQVRTDSRLEMKALDFWFNLERFTIIPGTPALIWYNMCVDWNWLPPWQCYERRDVTIIPAIPALKSPAVNLSLGPVWGPKTFAKLSKQDQLASGSFSLDGFQAITLDSFLLDPEVPPEADAGGPYTVDEGSTVALDATASHDADGDPLTYDWGFDEDGVFDDATGPTPVFNLTADDAVISVAVRVYDGLNEDTATADLTVLNVAPDFDPQADETVNEGVTVSRLVTFGDPGADTWDVAVDWGDGTAPDTALGLTTREMPVSHVYADNGAYTVSLAVLDDDGGSGTGSFTVTVLNVAPTVNAGADQTVDEGDLVSLDPATFNDLGTLDTHTATVNWGDGAAADAGVVTETPFGPPGSTAGADGTVGSSHVYADNGTYTVTVCDEDDDLAETCDTLTVTVLNVVPTLDAGADQTVDEGDLVSLDPATFNDMGTLDTHTATVNWGDATATEAGVVTESPFGPPGSTAGADGTVGSTHVYADNGAYTATVCVTDDELAETCDALTVTVDNVATTIAGADQTVDEGDLVSLDPATFNDRGTLDTHTATVNWGDGTATEAGAVTEAPFGPPGSTAGADGTVDGSHVYADNGTYAVTVCVEDDDGAEACGALTMTVDNVAPTVDAGVDTEVIALDLLSLDPATFNDLGTLDTHTANIDWSDGIATEAGVVTEAPFGPPGLTMGADGTVDGSHVYAEPGDYTVTVTVTDDDVGVGTDSLTVKVLGPIDLKTRTVEGLSEYSDESKRIEKAIKEINNSLDPELWDGTIRVDSKDGHKVFSRERHAVKELMHLLKGIPDDAKCDGIERIELRYTGAGPVDIDVFLKKELLASFTGVSNDELIEILATLETGGKLHSEIRLVVDGVEVEKIHTSCSKPIEIGDVHGEFTIEDLDKTWGESKGKGKDSLVSDEALAQAETAIPVLVIADRLLAQTLLNDLAGLTAIDPDNQEKVDQELQKALDELAKGDADRDAGKPDKAIQHYRKAWEHAGHAAKEAAKPAKPPKPEKPPKPGKK